MALTFTNTRVALIVDGKETTGLVPQFLPWPLLAKASQRLHPLQHWPVGKNRREVELGLRRHPMGEAGKEGARARVGLADERHVLFRHGPSSISRRSAPFHAK